MILQNLLIDWIIIWDFTAYRQYFSHKTFWLMFGHTYFWQSSILVLRRQYPTTNTAWFKTSVHRGSSYTPKTVHLQVRIVDLYWYISNLFRILIHIQDIIVFSYLLCRIGMKDAWHRLTQKQDQPLLQTSSVQSHFHFLHQHIHWLLQQS